MATFTDSFTGAVSTYWKQYGTPYTANGTNITSPSNTVTACRLIYDIGDQAADGDVTVTLVTLNPQGATFYAGVLARWSGDDHSNVTMTGYVLGVDASNGAISILKVTAHNTYAVLEATGVTATDGDTVGLRLTGTSLRALKNGSAIGVGVIDASYTSGGMGIFDQTGSTYDDFSGPTSAATAVPAARLTTAAGVSTDYPAITNTNRARGKALLDAGAATATAGDKVYDIAATNTFDLGTTTLYGVAGSAGIPVNFYLSANAIILAQPNLSACGTPNSHQEWHGVRGSPARLSCNTGQSAGSPFGHRSTNPTGAAGSYADVLLSDFILDGPIDALHFTTGGTRVVNLRCVRCSFNSGFDSFACAANSCADGSTLELIGCTFLSQYPHPTYPCIYSGANIGVTTRGLFVADSSLSILIHGCTIVCGGGGSSVNTGLLATLGTVGIFSTTVTTTGTNARSLDNNSASQLLTIGNDVTFDNTKSYKNGVQDNLAAYIVTAWTPAPPTDLAASGGNGSAWCSWVRNAVNDTGNTLEWATDAVFTLGTGSVSLGAGVTLGKATGLTNNTRYYFRVKATNATGDSLYSNIATTIPRNFSSPGRSGGGGGSSFGRGRRVLRTTRH